MNKLFPTLVIGDIHLKDDSFRLKEWNYLKECISKLNVNSYVFLGDIINKTKELPFHILYDFASFLSALEKPCYIVVGNHENEARSTELRHSWLCLISFLPNVHIFPKLTTKLLYNKTVAFWPYYDKSVPTDVDFVFSHKDIKELNKYYDTEFAISIKDFPKKAIIFNGHLHFARKVRNLYITGACYPATFKDNYKANRFLYILHDSNDVEQIEINITSFDKNDKLYKFFREKEVKVEAKKKIELPKFEKEFISLDEILEKSDNKLLKNIIAKLRGKYLKIEEF